MVRPAWRGRGVGAALYEPVEDARARASARSACSRRRDDDPSARAFAERRGLPAHDDRRLSSLDPTTVDPALLDALAAEKEAEGFTVAPFAVFRDRPELIHAVDAEASLDEPSDEPLTDLPLDDWLERCWRQPDLSPGGQLRGRAGRPAGRDRRADHVDVDGGRAANGFTGTLRAYRGRGLARLAKLASIAWLRDRGVTLLVTENDETNAADARREHAPRLPTVRGHGSTTSRTSPEHGRGRARPPLSRPARSAGRRPPRRRPAQARAAAPVLAGPARCRLGAARARSAGRPDRVPARARGTGADEQSSSAIRPCRGLRARSATSRCSSCPGYATPEWLDDDEAPAGTVEAVRRSASRLLHGDVRGLLWASADADPDEPLPLLVVHDGPEYATYSALVRMLDSAAAERELPPHARRAACARRRSSATSTTPRPPATRTRSSASCSRALDALAPAPPGREHRVGMGASLGALAMLHAHRVRPQTFGGPLPPVRQLLPRALRPPRARRSRASTGSPASSAPCSGRRAGRIAIPVVDDLRHGRGEPRQQPRGLRRARAAGVPGRAARDPRRAQLGRLARHALPRPRDAAPADVWDDARAASTLDGGGVLAYGHWGRPVLAFPSQQGECWQYEERGMVDAIGELLDAGRVKLYCVDSYDSWSWHDDGLPLEERARRHGNYESWILERVVPFIHDDCGGPAEIAVTGVSFGAYHAANFALKRADLFPLAICQSGVYDVSVVGWGERGDAVYFNNPMDYVAAPRRRPPRLAARARQPRCSCAARDSGRTRPARSRARSGSPACSGRRGSGTSSTSGATTSRTTGPRGAPSSLTTCRGSADPHSATATDRSCQDAGAWPTST